jgi:hypothetical protein
VSTIAVSIPWSSQTGECPRHLISPQDSAATQAAISDMSEISDTGAVITALRCSGGRHPDTVAFVLSCLLDRA